MKTISPLARMRQLGDLQPVWSWGFTRPRQPDKGYREVLPFQRSWPAILFMFAFAGVFSIPLVSFPLHFTGIEDLFDLTFALFSLFWLLGWSAGVLVILAIPVAMLFAREVLTVEPDAIRLRLEMFSFGIEGTYDRKYISNLRHVSSPDTNKKDMRGPHLAFDYFDVPVAFGSDMDAARARTLCSRINIVLSQPVPDHLSEAGKALLAGRKARNQERQAVAKPAGVTVPAGTEQPPATKSSLYLLVAANLVPLAGAFLLDWQVADIMLLFWFESAIIGFFNILKMFRISGPAAIFYCVFFTAHFGGFMVVHLMFIFALFIEDGIRSASIAEVAQVLHNLWPGIIALFISHGFSYRENFLHGKEYLHTTLREQMGKPYSRVVLMHITIIFGGFLILALKLKALALVLLVVMKIAADLYAHGKSHRVIRKK